MTGVERIVLGLVALLAFGAGPALAQQPAPADTMPTPPPGEIQLVYDREVFLYSPEGRRDPFRPLTADGLGPRFEQLILRGIIFSPLESRSVALLADGSGRIYRAKQGDLVGNAQVISIQPLRVVFRVESFGATRQEALDLKRPDIRGGQR
ncbi:MAG: hypothetical protein ACRELV_07770 [Longimicrobiales bacterium]